MELKRILILIGGAATVVTGVLALFGSVLRAIAPPNPDVSPDIYAGLASVAALILLLILVLLMPTRLSKAQRHLIVALCVVSGTIAVVCLFSYVAMATEYVFTYAETGKTEKRYLRGELTAMGQRMNKDMTIAEAVRKLGGMKIAQDNHLLWTEDSRKSVELRLLIWYVVAIAMLCVTLFSLAIALIASKRAK
jgi:hypothetical protein